LSAHSSDGYRGRVLGWLVPFVGRHRVALVTGAVGVVTLFVVVLLPLSVGHSAAHNHWTAIGAVAGLGALAFAFIATVVAVLAYAGSTLKPVLTFKILLCGRADPTLGGEAVGWTVEITLQNEGAVAARFIAVRVTLDDATFHQAEPPWRRSDDLRTAQWDGGVDTIIHPHWDAAVPHLTAFVTPQTDAYTFTAKIEAVADRAVTITNVCSVTIHEAAPPPTAG
jgi:hypothetical protein